jgi:CheY-like chemotaxis protein
MALAALIPPVPVSAFLAPNHKAEAGAADGHNTTRRQLKVFIVEDDDTLRVMLADVITNAGHLVFEAHSGEGVADRLGTETVDVLLTDVVMPAFGGLKLLMQLRALNKRPFIIAMSGGGVMRAEAYLKICRRLGCSAVLQKPFSVQTLLGVLAVAGDACVPTGSRMTGIDIVP